MDVTLGLVLITSRRQEGAMTLVTVRCLSCDSEQVVKRGKTSRGKQRVVYPYLADNP
jgi:hypothetical protein